MKLTVLGAGAWGTALAIRLVERGHEVALWGHNESHLGDLRRDRVNACYLPGISLPSELRMEASISKAVEGSGGVIVSVPSRAFRGVAAVLSGYRNLLVSVTKGIEHNSGLTMCGVLSQIASHAGVAALSGPSLAMEVAQGIPTAVVAASSNPILADAVQQIFNGPAFRVYTSLDQLGVELGGALKNVVAIAAGVCDGLGFGDNSKAALTTRGIAEIRRLGVACGAQPETFSGLSGLGDLTVTCFSKQSRNRSFGERLGRGESLEQIQSSTVTVAEGYPTALSAWQLGRKLQVETPIIDEVHAILYESKSPTQALKALMNRSVRAE